MSVLLGSALDMVSSVLFMRPQTLVEIAEVNGREAIGRRLTCPLLRVFHQLPESPHERNEGNHERFTVGPVPAPDAVGCPCPGPCQLPPSLRRNLRLPLRLPLYLLLNLTLYLSQPLNPNPADRLSQSPTKKHLPGMPGRF